MLGVHLYLAQRVSAALLAPLVLGHLILIIYAVRGGVSADEILARTQGSVVWAIYYGLFVLAVSVHAAIGLRVVVHEYFNLAGAKLTLLTWIVAILCLGMGFRAIVAVIL